jgi:hypothetical protein
MTPLFAYRNDSIFLHGCQQKNKKVDKCARIYYYCSMGNEKAKQKIFIETVDRCDECPNHFEVPTNWDLKPEVLCLAFFQDGKIKDVTGMQIIPDWCPLEEVK